MSETPEADRIAGAPHPRDTRHLYGQAEAEAAFLDAMGSGRLHHAWLITGPRGVGKATLAWKIAAKLLADRGEDGPGLFGEAPAPDTLDLPEDHPELRLIHSGAHPRLHVLRRAYDEKTGKLKSAITVDDVRGLRGFFGLSATDGGRRVVIVDSADEMNTNAANALLKLLEEPPARATLLLVSHQPSGILPTIRSRCRTLRCAPLSPEDIAAALDQAGITTEEVPALAALSEGSVGETVRLVTQDGLPLYADLVKLLGGLPAMDRSIALKLAESCAGPRNQARFDLMIDLIDMLLARAARAGIMGPPDPQGAPGEALMMARLSPHDQAARDWALLAQQVGARLRHGRAVNLDPAALILDTLLKIEETARAAAPAVS